MTADTQAQGARTVHELSPEERQRAVDAFTSAIGSPPDFGFAPDRAWLEGFAAALQGRGTQEGEPSDAVNAARYRFLRAQHWSGTSDHGLFVVKGSAKAKVQLGTFCPSGLLLDDAIDEARAALAQAQKEQQP